MALLDARADLAEHGGGAAASRGAADERDHAEAARERAAVLDLDERAHAVEPGRPPGRSRSPRRRRRRTRPSPRRGCATTVTFAGRPAERVRPARLAAQPVTIDAADACARRGRRPCGSSRAASFVTQQPLTIATSAPLCRLDVAVGEQPLADLVRIDVRDLAAEEIDAEAHSLRGSYCGCSTGRTGGSSAASATGLAGPRRCWPGP